MNHQVTDRLVTSFLDNCSCIIYLLLHCSRRNDGFDQGFPDKSINSDPAYRRTACGLVALGFAAYGTPHLHGRLCRVLATLSHIEA